MTEHAATPTLLVLRHHGLGDLVTAQPALRGLRRHFSAHRLVVTCPSWLVPLAEHLRTGDDLVSERSGTTPGADAAFDPSDHQRVDDALLGNVLTTIRTADVLVSLRTPGPEILPIVHTLAPRVLVSYRYSAIEATGRYPELDFSDHILTRWRRLLAGIGVAVRDEEMYATLVPPESHRGFTVVHIGAGSPSRLWPVERWSTVVGHLEAAGHRVLLSGTRREAARVAHVRRRAGLSAERDRSGALDIMELAQLVAGARLVVCGDTGISHLATAFRRPAVTLFGPVPPAWWGPPLGNPQHRTLWTGRTGDNYAARTDPGLLEISAEQVLHTIDELQAEGV
ncbi:MAG: glycosyltransferase family 9 protein [Vicinamibacterales bacterium]